MAGAELDRSGTGQEALAGGESQCAVCDQRLAKARLHYGGVTCYSCRAFFRRNTQREELPSCKVAPSPAQQQTGLECGKHVTSPAD